MAAFASNIYLQAQTISGYVTDGSTGSLLQGAVVTVFSDKETEFYETGLDGFYQIDLYPGTYTLSCSRFGYESLIMEGIKLEYDKIEVIDIKLYKPGAKPPQNLSQTGKKAVTADEEFKQQSENDHIAEPFIEQRSKAIFPKTHAVGIGLGYQLGEIGGISGALDLSLSRLFGGAQAASNIFLSLAAGHEKQAYRSEMFNDNSLDYQFAFTHADAGLKKIFIAGSLLISPAISFGLEQAKPQTSNVHQLIDNGYIYALYVKPSLSVGYAVHSNIVLGISANYYSMMQETANKDNLILATKIPGTESWKSWSYADDFFSNRKGIGFKIGLTVFF